VLVDPVPGEVAERNCRQSRRVRRGNAERRQIRDDGPSVVLTKEPDFAGNTRIECRHEFFRPRDRRGGVKRQAVDLHDTGVDDHRRQLDTSMRRTLDQPRRHRRTDDDTEIGTEIDQRVDDFNRAGGVAETMPADIKDYCSAIVQRRLAAPTLRGTREPCRQLRAVDRRFGAGRFGRVGIFILRQPFELIEKQQGMQ
jgi:hypothetical protein